MSENILLLSALGGLAFYMFSINQESEVVPTVDTIVNLTTLETTGNIIVDPVL